MPGLLEMDFTKADIPSLKRDMPKWYTAMPQSAKEWWEVFLQDIGKQTDCIMAENQCSLYQLKNHMNRATANAAETGDIHVLEKLVQLRENEVAPLQEVC